MVIEMILVSSVLFLILLVLISVKLWIVIKADNKAAKERCVIRKLEWEEIIKNIPGIFLDENYKTIGEKNE